MKNTNSFKVYVASVLFYTGEMTNNYPVMTTEYCYKSIESFMDFCELTARQEPEFATSNVFINCSEVQILEDGTVMTLNSKVRNFKNYER